MDVVQNRHIDRHRQEIARNAKESLAAFRAGQLKPQPVSEIIAELREELTEDEA